MAAFLAVFVYATQAIAFEWKPGFTLSVCTCEGQAGTGDPGPSFVYSTARLRHCAMGPAPPTGPQGPRGPAPPRGSALNTTVVVPVTIWQPGSAWSRWGSFQRCPYHLVGFNGWALGMKEDGRKEWREGEMRQGKKGGRGGRKGEWENELESFASTAVFKSRRHGAHRPAGQCKGPCVCKRQPW